MSDPALRPRGHRLRDYRGAIATLSRIRVERRITYRALAARIGVDRREVSRWLNGSRMPQGHRLFDLAAALGYDLALIPREDS